ncbi:hypothetical protein AgCh_040269 [Apium graveolens]
MEHNVKPKKTQFCNRVMLNSIPIIVIVVSFGLFSLLGGDLTPTKAFTSLSLFAVLRFPLFMLPNIITQIYRPQGTLVAIVGSTGEGKTSLVSAMLGELPAVGDTNVVIRGKVAYVSQVSWIFNATVRQNILFGSAFDPIRYSKAIDVTALRHDLDLLPVKEEGTFEELSNNGKLFPKLMENAGKLEEYVEDNEDGLNIESKISKPTVNGETEEVPQDASQTKKNEGKSILIKQERETGVVSWNYRSLWQSSSL